METPHTKAACCVLEAYQSPRLSTRQFLAPFSSLKIFRLLKHLFLFPHSHHIEGQAVSPATKVIFTRTMFTSRPLCLKMWLPCNNGIYNTEDEPSRWKYLLEGLEYNRRFARKIYLGIAPLEQESKDTIRRGRLIKRPQKSELKPGVQYALVMQCLDESWRLDHLLFEGKLNTKPGIEFLAKEVANMHDQLMLSPEGRGNPESISSKLAFNRRFFDEALKLLAHDDESVNKYKCIGRLMVQFCRVGQRGTIQAGRDEEQEIRHGAVPKGRHRILSLTVFLLARDNHSSHIIRFGSHRHAAVLPGAFTCVLDQRLCYCGRISLLDKLFNLSVR